MNNAIQNNNFYKTFTPFLTENTCSAEKTIKGNTEFKIIKNKKNNNFLEYSAVGLLLLIPAFMLIASKFHINKMMKALDKEYFLAANNEIPGGFLNGIAKYVRLAKYHSINALAKIVQPFKNFKDNIFKSVNNPENNSFLGKTVRNCNNLFKTQQTFLKTRHEKKLRKLFERLEKNIDKQLELIKSSGDGKIKVLLPKSVRKDIADETPHIIDFTKTRGGLDRVQTIKSALNEIKELLYSDKPDYAKIAKKITYSCEDIFENANDVLINLYKHTKKNSGKFSEIKPVMKNIYEDLLRYRYGEIVKKDGKDVIVGVRKMHIDNLMSQFSDLKSVLGKDSQSNDYINQLEEILKTAYDRRNMGLLERIRTLLKCKDVQTPYLKEGVRPALFKQVMPDKYIETKQLINDFRKSLNKACDLEKNIIPVSSDEIDRGKIFTDFLSAAIPAGVLGVETMRSTNKEKKDSNFRKLVAFLTGSVVMLNTHNYALCSRVHSILYGFLTSLLTLKILNRNNN